MRFGSSVSSPRQSGVAIDRVDDHLGAVLVHAGRVAAEDHRQPVLRQPDAAQRPQVVVVERRVARTVTVVHPSPASGSGRSPTSRADERVVGVGAGGVGGEHRAARYRADARRRLTDAGRRVAGRWPSP